MGPSPDKTLIIYRNVFSLEIGLGTLHASKVETSGYTIYLRHYTMVVGNYTVMLHYYVITRVSTTQRVRTVYTYRKRNGVYRVKPFYANKRNDYMYFFYINFHKNTNKNRITYRSAPLNTVKNHEFVPQQ